jgi:hypothetical protein
MNIETIDEAIDKYVHERIDLGQKRARERFISSIYLKHRGEELQEFMKKVGGLSRYYIDFLKVMENPFKGPEFAWLASMISVAIYAGMLMTTDDERPLGIFLLAGTLVNGISLIVAVAKNWCETGVMIAIYREIVQMIESEVGHQQQSH